MAGKRKGTEDDRFLWPEMFRLIRECKPTFVVAENVPGILGISGGMVFQQVCADLEGEGYEVQPLNISAACVGGIHQRERIWIVAYNQKERWKERSGNSNGENENKKIGPDLQQSIIGLSMERIDPNTNKIGLQECEYAFQSIKKKLQCNIGINETRLQWPSEPPVCSPNDGFPTRLGRNRGKQLQGYGNAIVPQVAYQIFKAIKKADEELRLFELQNQKNERN